MPRPGLVLTEQDLLEKLRAFQPGFTPAVNGEPSQFTYVNWHKGNGKYVAKTPREQTIFASGHSDVFCAVAFLNQIRSTMLHEIIKDADIKKRAEEAISGASQNWKAELGKPETPGDSRDSQKEAKRPAASESLKPEPARSSRPSAPAASTAERLERSRSRGREKPAPKTPQSAKSKGKPDASPGSTPRKRSSQQALKNYDESKSPN